MTDPRAQPGKLPGRTVMLLLLLAALVVAPLTCNPPVASVNGGVNYDNFISLSRSKSFFRCDLRQLGSGNAGVEVRESEAQRLIRFAAPVEIVTPNLSGADQGGWSTRYRVVYQDGPDPFELTFLADKDGTLFGCMNFLYFAVDEPEQLKGLLESLLSSPTRKVIRPRALPSRG